MTAIRNITRIRGPVDLPEALQGETLGDTLRKTADYLRNTPGGLPPAWGGALEGRLAPVLFILDAVRTELAVAEDQLQEAADRYSALLEEVHAAQEREQ